MWLLFIFLNIIFNIIFTQIFKIVIKNSKSEGTITILVQFIAGITSILISPLFKYTFSTDWKVYLTLIIACIFYSISDRMNTTVRNGIEASTFSIISQLATVFMISAGILFFKEPFILKKIIGAALIVLSNIFIFYKKGNQKINKYVILGIFSNIAYSIALFIDVNISNNFNLAIYVATTLLVSSLFIIIFEKIKFNDIKKEFNNSNKKLIFITGFSWSTMLICQLNAYKLGNITSVAPLCALTVIGNVIVSYIFLKERNNLLKKIIAAIIIIISVFLIQ